MIVSALLHYLQKIVLKDCDVLLKLDNEKSTESLHKEENNKQIVTKQELIELCKTDLNAQAANHTWTGGRGHLLFLIIYP